MHEETEPDLNAPATPGAATEEDMGALHGAVARTLKTVIVDGCTVVDKDGEVHKVTAQAAYIGAAIAFLKNNNITASPSRNKDLAALKGELAKKRQRKELTSRSLKEAADTFEQMQGANGMPMQ